MHDPHEEGGERVDGPRVAARPLRRWSAAPAFGSPPWSSPFLPSGSPAGAGSSRRSRRLVGFVLPCSSCLAGPRGGRRARFVAPRSGRFRLGGPAGCRCSASGARCGGPGRRRRAVSSRPGLRAASGALGRVLAARPPCRAAAPAGRGAWPAAAAVAFGRAGPPLGCLVSVSAFLLLGSRLGGRCPLARRAAGPFCPALGRRFRSAAVAPAPPVRQCPPATSFPMGAGPLEPRTMSRVSRRR